MKIILTFTGASLLSACVAVPPSLPVAPSSPNVNAQSNYDRCIESYRDLFRSSGGGEDRLKKICGDGARETAAAAQKSVAQLRAEAEQERLEHQRISDRWRAQIQADKQREQEEFDRSALGRALNSANRAMETHLERRAGATGSTEARAQSASQCPAVEPLFLTPERMAQWEQECGRISKQRPSFAHLGVAQVAPTASPARQPMQSSGGRANNVAPSESPGAAIARQALTPPFSVGDAPRRGPVSTVIEAQSTGRTELSAAAEGKVSYLHPDTKRPCVTQVGAKELSSSGNTEFFKFQNVCDAVFNLRIVDPRGRGHGNAIRSGSIARPSTYTISCSVEDRCGEGKWDYKD